MKKTGFLVLAILLLSCFTDISAAQKGYRGFVEAGYGMLMADKKGGVAVLSTSHGYLFNRFFLGGGIGLDYYSVKNSEQSPVMAEAASRYEDHYINRKEGYSVPVFVDMKGFFCSGKWSPMVDVKGGLSLGYATGLMAEAGAGVAYRFTDRLSLILKVYAKYAYEHPNQVTDDLMCHQGHFLNSGIRIGFCF